MCRFDISRLEWNSFDPENPHLKIVPRPLLIIGSLAELVIGTDKADINPALAIGRGSQSFRILDISITHVPYNLDLAFLNNNFMEIVVVSKGVHSQLGRMTLVLNNIPLYIRKGMGGLGLEVGKSIRP